MIAFGLTPEPVKAFIDRLLAENMELKALVQKLLARIEALEKRRARRRHRNARATTAATRDVSFQTQRSGTLRNDVLTVGEPIL